MPDLTTEPAVRFSSEWWLETLVGRPLTIVLLVLLALLARWLVHRAIDRFVAGLAQTKPPKAIFRRSSPTARTRALLDGAAIASERRAQRARTIGQLLKSVTTFAIGAVATVMALDVIGLPIAPLLASAGILGAALGFGSQNLVKDFLAGVFMLVEDQYGVGDVIDMGPANGTVESVSLRVTSLRDGNGTLWYVRNGEVSRVGNKSQGWGRAIVDITVDPNEDLSRVRSLLLLAATELVGEEEWAGRVLDAPEVPGVEELSRDSAVLRIEVRTLPGEQWSMQRALRERLSRALIDQGIWVAPGA